MNWEQRPLEAVATLQRGYDLPVQDRRDGTVPIFAANGIVGFHAEHQARGPGVVTGRSGSIGKVHYSEGPYWPLNTSLYVKNFHGNEPRYIYWLLRQMRLEQYHEGTGVPTLNRNVVHRELVPVPPLPEQRRIAAILDKADALRAKRREAIAKLDQLLQSVFLDMFGDPVTNPKGWPKATIGELASFITSGSRGWAAHYSESGALFIRIQNLVGGELDMEDCAFVNPPDSAEARRTLVQPGDVLVSITADLGRTAVVPTDIGRAHINQHIAILRLVDVNPAFVSHFLASSGGQQQFQKLNRSAVKAGLNFNDLRSLEVLMPSQAVQEKYLSVIAKVRASQVQMTNQLLKSDLQFAALQQQAFQGNL
ncbi:restriction endonuclease subunit S [Stenotrophobium rhamnosiphilum]|uniref:restriction endonuclease subunit S n=1 Tax=Stenotrophobium rhamnosiphilum TaxID=2029166 RepID=UPI001375084D|nr:restriction endonuclease subunit S [Stenotrophobium rhamnosiphilum]